METVGTTGQTSNRRSLHAPEQNMAQEIIGDTLNLCACGPVTTCADHTTCGVFCYPVSLTGPLNSAGECDDCPWPPGDYGPVGPPPETEGTHQA